MGAELADKLNFKQKVDRSLELIDEAYRTYRERLVVANSLGKDSMVVWHLAKRVSPDIKGFIVTTQFKFAETIKFMNEIVSKYPELSIYRSDQIVDPSLPRKNPDLCCKVLKVIPTSQALKDMNAACWITGLRCTEGRTRTDYQEVENRDEGLVKLNPILIWYEREIWQYLALNKVDVNPLYSEGYRSLGCEPCTKIPTGGDERDGRWVGTTKQGGECGIHTNSLMEIFYEPQAD